MEAIQNQRRVRAMGFDSPYVGITHVAAARSNRSFLMIAQRIIEEFINGFPAFSFAHPHHDRAIQIINQGRVLVSFAIGNLVYAKGLESSNPVSTSYALNRSMQLI